jgi:EAL domain-containing protein (putative c-di-GMP-specific phosphodiesterase class I)
VPKRSKPPVEAALGEVVMFLQPIVSVRQREVRVVEALARGIDASGKIRTPAEVFADAKRGGYQHELEQHCRRTALATYAKTAGAERAPILSLNTDTSLIQAGVRGAEQLVREVKDAGITPDCVALEILESAVSDVVALEAFCRTARHHGFLLALDDVGIGHSNLERIPRLEPDILKIDRVLVHGMSDSYHRREVFRSLLVLAHQIGALAIAEGVELEADVMVGLGLGCDLFQGFYFGKPRDPSASGPLFDRGRLHGAGDQLRLAASRRLQVRRARRRRSEQAVRALLGALKSVAEKTFEALLRQQLEQMPFVEAIYVLDEHGVQITDTIHRAAAPRQALFQPAHRGADQSLKPYFLMLQAGLERYTSEPYISSASGNFCITMSRYFETTLGRNYVLCCDLIVERDESA